MVQICVGGVRHVVVDVDPEGRIGCGMKGVFAEARFGGAVKGDTDLRIDGVCWRSLDFVASREKGDVFRESVFVDVVHCFSNRFECVTECDLGADGICVWADMAKENEGVVSSEGVGYFLE